MSMSEPSERAGTTPSAGPSGSYPADFTSDELQFAEALHGLFSPEREELPPLYVNTLTGDLSSRPMDPGFEQKMTYHVFSRLGLPRSPLFAAVPSASARQHHRVLQRVGRAGAALTACAMIFMALSVIFASPSFASGLRILLGHSGVQQVQSYPTHVRPSASMAPQSKAVGYAQRPMNLIDWFGHKVGNYTFENVEVLAPQEWSDGPIVDLRYKLATDSAGSGELSVREFHIAPTLSSVLQVVAEGSATPVKVGDLNGVYVDGQWAHQGLKTYWFMGVREELIVEQDGLIFWIVADQRDGLTASGLVAAAQQLTSIPLASLLPAHLGLRTVNGDLRDALSNPTGDDVFALVPILGSTNGNPEAFVTFAPGAWAGS
jgi:hypothetical protein